MEPAGRPAPGAVPLPDLGMEPGLVEPFRRGALAADSRVCEGRPGDRHRPLLPPPPGDPRPRPVDAAAPRLGGQRPGERPHRAVGAHLSGRGPHGAARDPGRLAADPSLEHRPHPWVCRAGPAAGMDNSTNRLSRQGRGLRLPPGARGLGGPGGQPQQEHAGQRALLPASDAAPGPALRLRGGGDARRDLGHPAAAVQPAPRASRSRHADRPR